MNTLTMKCPECLPNHRGAIFSAEYNDAMTPIWVCRNCGHEKLRGQRRRQKLSQAKFESIAVKIRDDVLARNSKISPQEIKKFSMTYDEELGHGFVVVETGMLDDEGTMASLVCRDYRHVHVTQSGAVKLMNPKTKGQACGWFNVVHGLVS